MTKKEMAEGIADELKIPRFQVREIVQRVFDDITATLVQQGRIELRNFGVFEVRRRKPRQARNPRTGAMVAVPARLVVTFKPGREMLQQVGRLKHLPNGKE